MTVGQMGEGPEDWDAGVRLLLVVVHASHARWSPGGPDAEPGDEGEGEWVGAVLAVQVGKRREEEALIAVEPPAHEHLQRVPGTVGEGPPPDPGRDVESRGAAVRAGLVPLSEVVGRAEKDAGQILLDFLVDVGMVRHDVSPVHLRVVSSSAPAVAVVEDLVGVPVLEVGVVPLLPGRPIELCCRPQPVVSVILIVVLARPSAAPGRILEASDGALGMEEEEFPG
mmetsp:Transcript_12368/g.43054  ORF Transcript_12368/g.43054 Transcript_12368/m.43054 type:complete len:225 (+) Transcript_12368:1130-1804(+)